jgi:hypothetical protein
MHSRAPWWPHHYSHTGAHPEYSFAYHAYPLWIWHRKDRPTWIRVREYIKGGDHGLAETEMHPMHLFQPTKFSLIPYYCYRWSPWQQRNTGHNCNSTDAVKRSMDRRPWWIEGCRVGAHSTNWYICQIRHDWFIVTGPIWLLKSDFDIFGSFKCVTCRSSPIWLNR